MSRVGDSRPARLLRALALSPATLGPSGAAVYWCQWLGLPLQRSEGNDRLRARRCAHPLYARPGSTDAYVFRQIFIEREYSCIDDLDDVRLVVDCGANVGYSSAYFLSRYPDAEVIAVEPDAGNYAMLQLNTAPYGDRISSRLAGVWSHAGTLAIRDGSFRKGREWTRQVREAQAGEANGIPAVDVGTLLRESGHERISILKIDIEGAEAVVFSAGCEDWLAKVDTLVIELHDDTSFGDCSRVFAQAISGQDFAVSRAGELTVCRRTQPAPS